jgi:hypothetical protein
MDSTHHIDTTVARNSDNAVERAQVNAHNRHGLSVKAGYLGGKERERGRGERGVKNGKVVEDGQQLPQRGLQDMLGGLVGLWKQFESPRKCCVSPAAKENIISQFAGAQSSGIGRRTRVGVRTVR